MFYTWTGEMIKENKNENDTNTKYNR